MAKNKDKKDSWFSLSGWAQTIKEEAADAAYDWGASVNTAIDGKDRPTKKPAHLQRKKK